MARVSIDPFEHMAEIYALMKKPGLLLTCGTQGNPITIGWGGLTIAWGKPVFTALVRHSRYSYELLEANGDFAVNVPEPGNRDLAKAVAWCGVHSGRDGDKCDAQGLNREPGITIDVPYIAECPLHLECRTVFTSDMDLKDLDSRIHAQHYPTDDAHKMYWGEILGAWKVKEQ